MLCACYSKPPKSIFSDTVGKNYGLSSPSGTRSGMDLCVRARVRLRGCTSVIKVNECVRLFRVRTGKTEDQPRTHMIVCSARKVAFFARQAHSQRIRRGSRVRRVVGGSLGFR